MTDPSQEGLRLDLFALLKKIGLRLARRESLQSSSHLSLILSHLSLKLFQEKKDSEIEWHKNLGNLVYLNMIGSHKSPSGSDATEIGISGSR